MTDEPLDDVADLPPDLRECLQAVLPAQRTEALVACCAYLERMRAVRERCEPAETHIADQQAASEAQLDRALAALAETFCASPASKSRLSQHRQ
jgi:hypothetical protein